MTTSTTILHHPVAWASLVLIASLAACGGGGDDSGSSATPKPPPAPAKPAAQSWEGKVVIDQSVAKAIVCVDLNQNHACDSDEPKSAATGTDGTYRVQYQPDNDTQAQQAQQAPLLALIGTDAVDAADPSSTAALQAFVMAAPAGKHAQINPLTTLVEANLRRGQSTLQAAQDAVAQQLGIQPSDIDDYQSSPLSTVAILADNPRTAAKLTAFGIENNSNPQAPLPADTAQSYVQLSRLDFTSVNDYRAYTRESDGVANAQGQTSIIENREGKAAGVALTEAQLFPATPSANALQLTSKGWESCTAKMPRLSTRGTPNRSSNCATLYYSISMPVEDVSGQSMADVVTRMQSGSTSLNNQQIPFVGSLTLTPGILGNATFPQGSRISTSVSIQLNQPRIINDSTRDNMGFADLESLIAARQQSNVVLSTAARTAGGLGWLTINGAQQQVRGAFIDASRIAFYRCEVDASLSNPRNCVWLQDGTYAIKTESGVRFIEIQGSPQTANLRGYTEYNNSVYIYSQNLPPATDDQVLSYSQRLNSTAWDAMRTTLGL